MIINESRTRLKEEKAKVEKTLETCLADGPGKTKIRIAEYAVMSRRYGPSGMVEK